MHPVNIRWEDKKVAPKTCSWLLGLGALLVFPQAAGSPSPLQLKGSFQQGGLVVGKTTPGTEVRFRGRPIRVSEEGAFLLGFGRDAPRKARLTLISPEGTRDTANLPVEQRTYDTQRLDDLPEHKVTPMEEHLPRILLDQAMVQQARSLETPYPHFHADFRWPVHGPISSVYGSQRILNGKPRKPHTGVDIAAPAGTLVRAPAPGQVRLAEKGLFFSGGTLILDHGHGLSSSYLHLGELLVEEGERVEQGDLIARVGASGRATGAHLDWRINLHGCSLDPALVAAGSPTR
ncbi:MAG: M23 family metallopeptidase [Thiohalorhabdus sp.]